MDRRGRYPRTFVGPRLDRLCAALADGRTAKNACAHLGMSYHSFCLWMMKGAAPDAKPPYPLFYARVEAAKREGRTKERAIMRRGRMPNPISDEQQAALFDALRANMTYHESCRIAGVRVSTFLSWLRLGGHPHGQSRQTKPLDPRAVAEPYQSFAHKVLAIEHGESPET